MRLPRLAGIPGRVTAVDHGRRRPIREASLEQIIATGAGGHGIDDTDGAVGYRSLTGSAGRPVPAWTRERAVRASVAGYRANPMVKSIIDTYVAFAVGDSGVTVHSPIPEVYEVAHGFWHDPRNAIDQEAMFRAHLLQGETLYELMVGPTTGVVRRNVIDPARIRAVSCLHGNALWPDTVTVTGGLGGLEETTLVVAAPDDLTGLIAGEAVYWASFRALETDVRGFPFLGPVLDWVDSYDQVLSNLVDRTALGRYLVWDVTVDGDGDDVAEFVRARGTTAPPRSGSIEVHNRGIEWKPMTAQTGAFEDTATASSVLTSVAAGTGLSKPWLSESDDANKATSWSMAEPVRRRIGSVQRQWLARQTELVRYAVDQAVAAGRLPAMVDAPDGRRVLASSTVTVTGPALAASDARITADVIVRLSRGLGDLVDAGILPAEAAKVAARKAWEDYLGVPWRPELDDRDADPDDVADHVDTAGAASPAALAGAAAAPTKAAKALAAAEVLQKTYLAVGKVITSDEARALVNAHGGTLAMPGPDFTAT
jgi:hypothetical protein